MFAMLDCNLISFPVAVSKFTSCQLFLFYLVAPFLTASKLFSLGISYYMFGYIEQLAMYVSISNFIDWFGLTYH